MSSKISFNQLQDPEGLLKGDPTRLTALQTKITSCLTRMCKKPQNGGNPFLFYILFTKPQKLTNTLRGKPFLTAYTDGKIIGWNPDFLESLDSNEIATVMAHEMYHVIFYHPQRMLGKKHRIANIAMDYCVNNQIESDHEANQNKPVLWGVAGLGNPITMATYLEYIDGGIELNSVASVTFVDPAVRDKSPEQIYEIIMEHVKTSQRRCKSEDGGCDALSLDPKTGLSVVPKPWNAKGCCPKCGAEPESDGGYGKPIDEHGESAADKGEILKDLLKASNYAKSMQGKLSTNIETLLGTLLKPQLRARDIIRNARMRYRLDQGNMNNYKSLRRRGLSNNPTLFQWNKKDYASEWVAMIDTSGSMSNDDIINGIKELQLVAVEGRGWIIPCDAKPHWKAKIEINAASDITRTRIVGRGSTLFDEFFAGLPKHFPEGYDTVVIITDGDVNQIPHNLKPNCDVVWVITNDRPFTPSFGRVCQLKPANY